MGRTEKSTFYQKREGKKH